MTGVQTCALPIGFGLGGWGEYALVDEGRAIKVAEDTPLEIACVIGCAVQTGVGAVLNTAKVAEGATVLIVDRKSVV